VVEILPGLEGLVHVSQLDIARVENVADAVAMGQDLEVKVIAVEPNGRIRLSRKAVLLEEQGETIDLNDFAAPSRPRGDRPGGDRGRGGDRGGDRGGRGGDRGGRR
jgi:polyribonucleotide nucleotidyltransferase